MFSCKLVLFFLFVFCLLCGGMICCNLRNGDKFLYKNENFQIPTTGMEMVHLDAGKFLMGDRYEFENFLHSEDWKPTTVTLANGFWIGKYEVTQGEFRKIMKDYPMKGEGRLPATHIGWGAAVLFCNQLTEIEKKAGRIPKGYVFRLPTDAEWEYACRAGTKTRFSFGDNLENVGNYAWFVDNSDMKIHHVGLKKPNQWGLFDMYGNVSEVCLDAYSAKHDEKARVEEDPLRIVEGFECILVRGMAYDESASLFSSSSRHWAGMSYYAELPETGFRIVLAKEPAGYNELLNIAVLIEREDRFSDSDIIKPLSREREDEGI